MAFTMHSHSGEFCPGHAKDQLEDIVQYAISRGYKTMALTEHMQRLKLEDLYPEELPYKDVIFDWYPKRHEAYLTAAKHLQGKYASQIHILVGFEGEWLGLGREAEYSTLITDLAADPRVDFFLGSIHHVDNYPIDFDREHYLKGVRAVAAANGILLEPATEGTAQGGSGDSSKAPEEKGKEEQAETIFFETYYDRQRDMLNALQPKVVGHFDLVRLMSKEPDRDPRERPAVWQRVLRNLEIVRGYDGLLEVNTSGLRKGMKEPYPGRAISEAWLRMGGRFTFSDDSHGIAQVATNYIRGLDYLESLGVDRLWTFERSPHPDNEVPEGGVVRATLTDRSVSIAEFRASLKLE